MRGAERSGALWERLRAKRLIALISPRTGGDCVAAYEALDPLGVVLEIAFRTDAALEGIRAVRAKHPDALLLAGTVLTAAQAELAIEAGAAGVVSPDYFPDVVAACMRHDVICIPGGLAEPGKTLVHKAALLGIEPEVLRARHPHQWVYKLFPAMTGAPGRLETARAWKAVYPGLTVVYTGGVTAENVGRIAKQDPDGIVCASALTRHVNEPARMRAEAERWLEILDTGGAIDGTQAGAFDEAQARPAVRPLVVTFGEIMLRLSPPGHHRLGQVQTLEATFGGAEANVAVALSNLGLRARFVTAVPDHAVGQAAVNALRAHGVETDHVLQRGSRLGIYYLEHGAAQRPSRVIYDRAGSAMAAISAGQVDWSAALAGATWFHTSGITPALGDGAAEATREALAAAHAAGLTVSLDLNYRGKLWSREKARAVMTPLMEYVDIVVGNEADAADFFGIRAERTDVGAGKLDVSGYESVARELVSRFGLKMAAITLRESRSASDNRWSACLFDGTEFHVGPRYDVHLVDRVGGGDAFSAGLIHGLATGKPTPAALAFGVAASCLKQTIPGDFSLVSAAEVEALAGGDTAGRIQR
jgi:2-dehydro-3-deoxygluconokinase